jgi:hypothetical protein
VIFDILCPVGPTAKTAIWVRLQKITDQLSRVERNTLRKFILAHCDLSVHFIGIVIVERGISSKHLEE